MLTLDAGRIIVLIVFGLTGAYTAVRLFKKSVVPGKHLALILLGFMSIFVIIFAFGLMTALLFPAM